MVKYCSSCGKEVQNDTKFCPECGKSLVESEIPNKSEENHSNKKIFGYLCLGVIIIFLICGLAGFVSTIFDDSPNETNTQSNGESVFSTMLDLDYIIVDSGVNDGGNYFESYGKDKHAIVAQFMDNEKAEEFADIGFSPTSYNGINGYGGEISGAYEFVYDLKNGTALMFVVEPENTDILNDIVKDY